MQFADFGESADAVARRSELERLLVTCGCAQRVRQVMTTIGATPTLAEFMEAGLVLYEFSDLLADPVGSAEDVFSGSFNAGRPFLSMVGIDEATIRQDPYFDALTCHPMLRTMTRALEQLLDVVAGGASVQQVHSLARSLGNSLTAEMSQLRGR